MALPAKAVVRALLLGLGAPQDERRWRAVWFLGRVAATLAGRDTEAGREVLRRLMWSLNEESGAIGWGAAEAMAEIMSLSPVLADEFAKLLFSYLTPCANFLEHPPLQRGAVWALGRLALARPDLARSQGARGLLEPLLSSPDSRVAGLAAWALGNLGPGRVPAAMSDLQNDATTLCLLRDGRVLRASVGQLSRRAMARMTRTLAA